MNDHPTEPHTNSQDDDLDELEAVDPADAPPIAEELAARLASDLDGTHSAPAPGPEDRS